MYVVWPIAVWPAMPTSPTNIVLHNVQFCVQWLFTTLCSNSLSLWESDRNLIQGRTAWFVCSSQWMPRPSMHRQLCLTRYMQAHHHQAHHHHQARPHHLQQTSLLELHAAWLDNHSAHHHHHHHQTRRQAHLLIHRPIHHQACHLKAHPQAHFPIPHQAHHHQVSIAASNWFIGDFGTFTALPSAAGSLRHIQGTRYNLICKM